MTEPLVSPSRLQTLRSAVGGGDAPLFILIHDYPDPDALASALVMQTLARSWGVNSVIAHGGFIGRGENIEMVRSLGIALTTFDVLPDPRRFRGAVILDTQPEAKNQSLPPDFPVLGVIDHHHLSDDSVRLPGSAARRRPGDTKVTHTDIRTGVGSTSTLMLGYLEAAGIVPDAVLATALFLGIKTDTDGLLRDAAEEDVLAYTRLLPLADLKLAARIIHPPLEKRFLCFLHDALGQATACGTTLIAFCGDIPSPDMLSAVSDALIPVEGARYALAAGCRDGRIYLSLRAKPPAAGATRVLLRAIGPGGRGGGHTLSAGGFVNIAGDAGEAMEALRLRLLEATGDIGHSKEKLIP